MNLTDPDLAFVHGFCQRCFELGLDDLQIAQAMDKAASSNPGLRQVFVKAAQEPFLPGPRPPAQMPKLEQINNKPPVIPRANDAEAPPTDFGPTPQLKNRQIVPQGIKNPAARMASYTDVAPEGVLQMGISNWPGAALRLGLQGLRTIGSVPKGAWGRLMRLGGNGGSVLDATGRASAVGQAGASTTKVMNMAQLATTAEQAAARGTVGTGAARTWGQYAKDMVTAPFKYTYNNPGAAAMNSLKWTGGALATGTGLAFAGMTSKGLGDQTNKKTIFSSVPDMIGGLYDDATSFKNPLPRLAANWRQDHKTIPQLMEAMATIPRGLAAVDKDKYTAEFTKRLHSVGITPQTNPQLYETLTAQAATGDEQGLVETLDHLKKQYQQWETTPRSDAEANTQAQSQIIVRNQALEGNTKEQQIQAFEEMLPQWKQFRDASKIKLDRLDSKQQADYRVKLDTIQKDLIKQYQTNPNADSTDLAYKLTTLAGLSFQLTASDLGATDINQVLSALNSQDPKVRQHVMGMFQQNPDVQRRVQDLLQKNPRTPPAIALGDVWNGLGQAFGGLGQALAVGGMGLSLIGLLTILFGGNLVGGLGMGVAGLAMLGGAMSGLPGGITGTIQQFMSGQEPTPLTARVPGQQPQQQPIQIDQAGLAKFEALQPTQKYQQIAQLLQQGQVDAAKTYLRAMMAKMTPEQLAELEKNQNELSRPVPGGPKQTGPRLAAAWTGIPEPFITQMRQHDVVNDPEMRRWAEALLLHRENDTSAPPVLWQ